MRKIITRILFALGALFLLVVAFGFWRHFAASPTDKANTCISNLLQIEGAKYQYADENNLPRGAPVTAKALLRYIKGSTEEWLTHGCPAGGVYTIGPIGERPRCSIPGHAIDPADRATGVSP